MASTKKRKKNPAGAGTGAFLGSILGGTAGTLLGLLVRAGNESAGTKLIYPLAYLGHVGGAAVGGHMAAANDRKQRATVGSAVGAAVFPLFGIGAAVGGWIGDKKPDRKSNPSALAMGGAAIAAVAVATLGYYGYRKLRPRLPASLGGSLPAADALEGVVVPGATLGESALMLADIRQPIALSTQSNLQGFNRVDKLMVAVPAAVSTGEPLTFAITQPSTAIFGNPGETQVSVSYSDGSTNVIALPSKAIGALVTNLEPTAARTAYELALHHIRNKGVDWSDGAQRDNATKAILKAVAPKMDWSQGLQPYTFGSLPYQVWASVQMLGTVAMQSLSNKDAMASS